MTSFPQSLRFGFSLVKEVRNAHTNNTDVNIDDDAIDVDAQRTGEYRVEQATTDNERRKATTHNN